MRLDGLRDRATLSLASGRSSDAGLFSTRDALPLNLLQGLTDAQQQAVEHFEGPLLILAGPGSGKTRVVTHRIARLLQRGVADREILALTFTNKAADEMRSRLATLAPGARVWMGTFHRFCSRLLRTHARCVGLESNFTIYDADDSRRALKHVLKQLELDHARFTPDRVAAAISWAKNQLLGPEEFAATSGGPLAAFAAGVYPEYQRRLLESNAVDFDDLLLHVVRLLAESPEIRAELDAERKFILVDEYQDTNAAQYAIVRALSHDYRNLAVTGDPDQSIYGWRGADLRNILDFERDFPEVRVVRLERNYRSTKSILAAADALIAHNQLRKEKRLFTENVQGAPVRMTRHATGRAEADDLAERMANEVGAGRRRWRDFAILYRMNALSRTVEIALRTQGIPYQIVNGHEFFQRKEIKDVLAYLRVINNPRDETSLLRVINTPPRGMGAKTVAQLGAHAWQSGRLLLEAICDPAAAAGLSKRAATAVRTLAEAWTKMIAAGGEPVEAIVGTVLSDSGYQAMLQGSDDPVDADRLANIEELLTVAREYDERGGEEGLEGFLEETSLVSDVDAWEEDQDHVTLMTLHSSKGLEFPVVFVIAAEDGLLPHERSRNVPEQLEEERRLLFVGMTRAMEELHLNHAARRDYRGQSRLCVPSQFLMELPREQMDVADVADWDAGVTFEAEPEEEFAPPPEPSPPKRPAAPPQLTTAAELAGTATATPSPSVSPEEFHQGMLVQHPEYGLGKIVALSGSQRRRTATVAFASAAGRRKFVLAQSHLVPAGGA